MEPSEPNLSERRLRLEGPVNFRDLGGHPTRDGGQTRRGVLFRADSLFGLSPNDLDRLSGIRLRTAVDLRTGEEVERHPNHFAGSPDVTYHHWPVPVPPHNA